MGWVRETLHHSHRMRITEKDCKLYKQKVYQATTTTINCLTVTAWITLLWWVRVILVICLDLFGDTTESLVYREVFLAET